HEGRDDQALRRATLARDAVSLDARGARAPVRERYLTRKYDTGLWPRTLADEGRAFQWSLWVMTEAEEPVITALLHRRVFPEAQRRAAKAADAGERFKKRLAVLEGALAGRPYLLGEAFTVADLNVASVLAWAPLAGLELAGAP